MKVLFAFLLAQFFIIGNVYSSQSTVQKISFTKTSQTNNNVVLQQSQISPESLLEHAYNQWVKMVDSKTGCSVPIINSISGYEKSPTGSIREIWKANVCGEEKLYAVMLIPNGSETMVIFGELTTK